MKNERGYFSMETYFIVGLVAIFLGLIGFGAWKLYDLGGDHRAAEYEKKYAEERAARVEMISGLALELAARTDKNRKERLDNEREVLAAREERNKVLHAYVPSSSACIRAGFVRFTNAAAAGVPIDARPGPGVAQAPTGVGDDQVAAVIARNYDRYNDCKRKVGDILKDFDTKREAVNSVVDRINQRLKRAERKVQ